MASVLGKSVKLGIGATPAYLKGIRSVEFDPGEVTLVATDIIDEDPPTFLSADRTNATITLTVEKDKADTNGQLALATAFAAKTSLAFTLAPEGSTAGAVKITGTLFVKSMGKESFDKKSAVTKNIVLQVSGAYTEGVFP
jgi:hypothetical protein